MLELLDFRVGAQVMPGKDALLHISQIADERGRMKLSIKAAAADDAAEASAQ